MKFSRNGYLHSAALALLIISAIWIYASSLKFGFLQTWDDNYYVTFNPLVRSMSSSNIIGAFTSFRVGNYAPVHILSYMIDYSLWGYNPTGYRLENLFLHILNGCLLYALTVRFFSSKQWALFTALLFIAHPVQVESVAWISERKNLLSMTFFLAAFHAFIAYRNSDKKLFFYLSCIVLFSIACLSKSAAVVFPLIIVLYDLLLTDKSATKLIIDKLPFMIIAALTAWTTILSQSSLESGGGITGLFGGLLSSHIFTSLSIFPDYLQMLFWPFNLSALYTINIITTPDVTVVISLTLIILATAGGYLLYQKKNSLFFWYMTALICLLPVMQIVPLVTLRNDRYLYFPMIGIAVIAGYFADFLIRSSGRSKLITISLLATILMALAAGSQARSQVWRDDITLWTDATIKQPGCAKAWDNLGEAYHNVSNLPATAEAYSRSIALDGDNLISLNNLIVTYAEMGLYSRGMPYAERLVLLEPSSYVGHKNLGIALFEKGRKTEARQQLEIALQLRPGDKEVLQQLARMGVNVSSP